MADTLHNLGETLIEDGTLRPGAAAVSSRARTASQRRRQARRGASSRTASARSSITRAATARDQVEGRGADRPFAISSCATCGWARSWAGYGNSLSLSGRLDEAASGLDEAMTLARELRIRAHRPGAQVSGRASILLRRSQRRALHGRRASVEAAARRVGSQPDADRAGAGHDDRERAQPTAGSPRDSRALEAGRHRGLKVARRRVLDAPCERCSSSAIARRPAGGRSCDRAGGSPRITRAARESTLPQGADASQKEESRRASRLRGGVAAARGAQGRRRESERAQTG